MIQYQPGPQQAFNRSRADIAILGGSSGGGKTFSLLTEPLRHIAYKGGVPGFSALLFRNTYKQITMAGAMWEESERFYPMFGGKANQSKMEWVFPSGGKIGFAYLDQEKDKYMYKGAQIPLLMFDQIEEISETQFWYMMSRNRSTCGVKPYLRASCNPDPDHWIAKFIEWWINQETGFPIQERSGKLRWVVRRGYDITWLDSREDARSGERPLSVTFIPAKLQDNPILMEKDPDYLSRLMSLPPIEMERLLHGNWKVREAKGMWFRREWYELVDAVPAGGIVCRFWDFAATEKETSDYTASTLMKYVEGRFYVLDSTADRLSPADTDTMFFNLTLQDWTKCQEYGIPYLCRWELEGGSSGLRDASRLVREMITRVGPVDCMGIRASGDKLVRAKPLIAQSQAGNVKVRKAAWNSRWLDHLHAQGEETMKHFDILDATNGAFTVLASYTAGGGVMY